MADQEPTNVAPVFRARKKRKLLPQRDEPPDAVEEAVDTADAAVQDRPDSTEEASASADGKDGHDDSVTRGGLRKAKAQRPRGMGLRFTPFDAVAAARQREESNALVISQAPKESGEPLLTIDRRFAPQSGHISVSNDKNMNAFVDTELARLHGRSLPDAEETLGDLKTDLDSTEQEVARHSEASPDPVVDPISLNGRSHERSTIPDIISNQIGAHGSRTIPAAATARPRPTGRSRPPRQKGRERTEEDRRRDEAVEAVLSEAKLDIFEERKTQRQYTGVDGEADERVAAEYKRAFLETLQNRSAPRKPPAPPGVGKDQPKGPKLGGSRSARAAMHAKERADAAKKK